jgi:hypothetical protein
MKTLLLAAIRCSLMFTAVTASLFFVRPVQAYTVTLEQRPGSRVVAIGSGAINLTGLTFGASLHGPSQGAIRAVSGVIQTGPMSVVNLDRYSGFTGPTSFGSRGSFFTNNGGGDFVGISNTQGGSIYLPQGYVSGAALSDHMAFNNATLASLGVTPGTYVWTWGTGLPNQNFTLIIGGSGVPDGGSTVSLLGCALLGLAALRRKLTC